MNIVLSFIYSCSADINLPNGQNTGKPEAIFISDIGRRKDEELGSGLNASYIFSFDSERDWSIRMNVTF